MGQKKFAQAIFGVPIILAALIGAPAHATVIHTWSGLSSTNVQVSFEAHLTISGNTLTVNLLNTSPVDSLNPNDTLGSYYWDMVCGGVRPTLTYVSATGDVWWVDKDMPDTLITAGADLLANSAGDDTWQFRHMNIAFSPFMRYGVGTVGNNGLSPNNFMGNIVDGRDYSIYKGEITTSNLDQEFLVKEQATYVFTGVSGCTEGDILSPSAFGLGTAPDSLEFSPEPATLALLAFGALALVRRRR